MSEFSLKGAMLTDDTESFGRALAAYRDDIHTLTTEAYRLGAVGCVALICKQHSVPLQVVAWLLCSA